MNGGKKASAAGCFSEFSTVDSQPDAAFPCKHSICCFFALREEFCHDLNKKVGVRQSIMQSNT